MNIDDTPDPHVVVEKNLDDSETSTPGSRLIESKACYGGLYQDLWKDTKKISQEVDKIYPSGSRS